MIDNINELLKNIVGEENILINEPMKDHTTFKIGGNADYFVTPVNENQIQELIVQLKRQNISYYIIGNGSNLLVSDKGFRGVIIQIFKKFDAICVKDLIIEVQAGALLSRLSNVALENGLQGLEFASGIPGTVGGAVCMNAGAYTGEIKDIIVSTRVIDQEGNIFTLTNEELDLGYRTSSVMRNSYIVLSAEFKLEKGIKKDIEELINYYTLQRKTKQPLEYPSAGSTFKRPVGYFAGKLIMDSGLKGYSVGGAAISDKHSGFVINTGNATSQNVIELIQDVQRIVQDKFGVLLETEIRLIGEK
jgi:UDP-N-acetylmuramate dehydrogenase